MADVIPLRPKLRPLAKCQADVFEPLVAAELMDGRIAIRVPFASSFITADEARDFACRLVELAEELDGE